MSGEKVKKPDATAEDIIKYQQAWSDTMIKIWQEKIVKLKVVNTWKLHQSIEESVRSANGDVSVIQHKFMQYGIYQDVGTGKGYKKDNGGDLYFLDPKYREEHHLGEPRKPREWFSRSYYISVQVLKDQMAHMYGEEFCGLLVDRIEEQSHTWGASLRSRLWGRHK